MTEEKQTVSLDEFEAALCRDSFYDFVRQFWDTIIPEKPVWNWHIPLLCDELQTVAERVFEGKPKLYDLVINISPGSTKSTICTRMFPAWVWTRMASARHICGSHNYLLALDLGRSSRDIVTSDKYRRLFPKVQIREDSSAKGFFVNTAGGSRLAVGTGGVAGFHGHFIVIDDPLDPNKVVSDKELKAANEWVKFITLTRKVDKAITPVILIMQRLHQNDPTANKLDSTLEEGGGKVRHICLPAEIDATTAKKRVRPRILRHKYVDGLMDPVRLSREVLQAARKGLGEFMYSAQFLQSPVPITGGMFKTERIKVDHPPTKWKMLVRFWDKAGTEGGGAYTVGVLMGEDLQGVIWILDVIRVQLDTGAREKLVKQTAQLDKLRVTVGVEQEPGSGGKESAENTVKNLKGFRVVKVRPTGDKTMRAVPFSSQVNEGNVRMARGEWNREYLGELQYFPNSTYKDQVDASSGAFTVLTRYNIRVGGLK